MARISTNDSQDRVTLRSYTVADLGAEAPFMGLTDPDGWLPADATETHTVLRENPLADPRDLALVLALAGDRVVGRLGCYAGRVQLSDEVSRAFFLSGFFVTPAFRQTGVGGLLLLRVLSVCQVVFASGAPDESARALYERLRFLELGPLRRFLMPLRPVPVTHYLTGRRWLGQLLSPMLFPGLLLYTRWAVRRRSQRVRTSEVDCLPSEIDVLRRGDHRNCFPLDSAMLFWAGSHSKENWRYTVSVDNVLAGYAILARYRHPGVPDLGVPPTTIACLKDYYLSASTQRATDAFLAEVLTQLRRLDADLVECQVGDPAMAEACRRAGMLERGGNRVFLGGRFSGKAACAREWRLTYSVGDQVLV